MNRHGGKKPNLAHLNRDEILMGITDITRTKHKIDEASTGLERDSSLETWV